MYRRHYRDAQIARLIAERNQNRFYESAKQVFTESTDSRAYLSERQITRLQAMQFVQQVVTQRLLTIQQQLETEFPILQQLRATLPPKTDFTYPSKLLELIANDPDTKNILEKVSRKLPTTANDVLRLVALATEFVLIVIQYLQSKIDWDIVRKGLMEEARETDQNREHNQSQSPKTLYEYLAQLIIESKATKLAKLLWITLDVLQFLIYYNGISAYQRFEKNLTIAIERRFRVKISQRIEQQQFD